MYISDKDLTLIYLVHRISDYRWGISLSNLLVLAAVQIWQLSACYHATIESPNFQDLRTLPLEGLWFCCTIDQDVSGSLIPWMRLCQPEEDFWSEIEAVVLKFSRPKFQSTAKNLGIFDRNLFYQYYFLLIFDLIDCNSVVWWFS